jgi:predicted dehydrogenase
MSQFENFERAFRGGVSGCRRDCECGIEYWDSYNGGYDWGEGEVESLMNNPKAKALDHAVGIVEFEGCVYVDGCTCWHERARKIIAWMVHHDEAIAEFLSLEKERKQREANRAPTVRAV